MKLRDYQESAIQKLRASMAAGKKAVILQASCGAGKTLISADIAKRAIEKDKKVLFLVNRRDLVKQTLQKYQDYGLDPGVIMAGFDSELSKPIQIASLQTYGRRLNFDDPLYNSWFHAADLVIYDEAHSCNAKTYRKIIELYKEGSYLVGLSATPMRGDGTGLGEVFDDIVQCIPTAELIERGFLVPMTYYAPSKPDLDKIRTVAGDYDKKELGKRVDQPKLVGDIFDNWARLAGERQTIVFATNVKHSKHIRDHFRARGINIEHVDAHTNDETREQVYYDFENGNVQVLTNVGIATEGSDLPWASCIVIARPTKVLGRWIQMAGRGARPYNGKYDCILLDHAGCVEAHGFIEDDIEWSLEGKKPAARKTKRKEKQKKPLTCDECMYVFFGRKCPQCGTEVPDYGKKIETMEAELVKVKGCDRKYTVEDKRRWYAMLLSYRLSKGYKQGWVAWSYRERFGVWPRGMDGINPRQPDVCFQNYMKHLVIKKAKEREREAKLQEASCAAPEENVLTDVSTFS